jgi:hypothetical protein
LCYDIAVMAARGTGTLQSRKWDEKFNMVAKPKGEQPRPAAWPLRPADCLWRPWYAKIWWASVSLFWLGKAVAMNTPSLAGFYDSNLIRLTMIAFFPLTPLLILGIPFARQRLGDIEWGAIHENHDNRFGRSIGGTNDPASDPLDPRSGTNWVGDPNNIAKQFGRHWP